mmetsp:Transcript_23600/g.73520  ORF Transcript_23600/g.73520 Transcript_23600/m.73520 type:complete len:263 (-) Transcript_23600:73-861(-)
MLRRDAPLLLLPPLLLPELTEVAECTIDPVGAAALEDEGTGLAEAKVVACRAHGRHAGHAQLAGEAFQERRKLLVLCRRGRRRTLRRVHGAALRLHLHISHGARQRDGRNLAAKVGPLKARLHVGGNLDLGALHQELAWLVGLGILGVLRAEQHRRPFQMDRPQLSAHLPLVCILPLCDGLVREGLVALDPGGIGMHGTQGMDMGFCICGEAPHVLCTSGDLQGCMAALFRGGRPRFHPNGQFLGAERHGGDAGFPPALSRQ